MRKGNLIKMAAPAILSAAMMVSGLPVMAADFTSDTAVETEAQTDEFDAADDTADAFAGDEETPFVDDQAAAEDEFAATADTGYKYVYAGLTWAQYWASEGVYNAANTASNGTKDSHDELDKGGFDTVTRATVNHGLHRGSYQCEAIMYDKNGGSYEISYWTSANDAVLTDGTTVKLNQPERGQITKTDGSVVEFDHYNVVGLKYVPVAVKAEDYEAFKSQFKVVEDGSTVAGGFGENNLQSYSAVADVTAETNGLKEAVKGSDGTFTFKARTNGTGSGLKDQALQTASNVTATVKEASGSYGEFLRVDIIISLSYFSKLSISDIFFSILPSIYVILLLSNISTTICPIFILSSVFSFCLAISYAFGSIFIIYFISFSTNFKKVTISLKTYSLSFNFLDLDEPIYAVRTTIRIDIIIFITIIHIPPFCYF